MRWYGGSCPSLLLRTLMYWSGVVGLVHVVSTGIGCIVPRRVWERVESWNIVCNCACVCSAQT